MAGDLIAGRYRLIEPLGRGAMSAVWLAEDEELGRRVALKTLAPSADRERFEREARAVAGLSHPNICSLFNYGEADGKPFMVLEYLPNGSLEDRLKDGKPLPDAEAQRIATEIAAGLAHAHERGLVHRDLKPANVLFDAEQRAKIADFGIARMGGAGTLTEAGTVLGTASYISPEQAAGKGAGPASDVYSFGVILFRMLTGRLPFVSTNAMELVRMHRDDPPPAVSDFRPGAPPRLERVADAALAKDPAARLPDGSALLYELRGGEPAATVLAGAVVVPAETDATQVLRRPAGRSRRGPGLVSLLALALVLLGAGVALALVATHKSGTPPVQTLQSGSLSLPAVGTAPSSTGSTTTATSSSVASTTAASTTQPAATTRPQTTTRPATTTTHRTTTAAPTTTFTPPPPTTFAPPPTTTAATTDTTGTTTTVGP